MIYGSIRVHKGPYGGFPIIPIKAHRHGTAWAKVTS